LHQTLQFDDDGPSFAFKIQRNVKRYLTLFSTAVDKLLPLPDQEVNIALVIAQLDPLVSLVALTPLPPSLAQIGIDDDVLDVIIAHRMKQFDVNHRDELTKHFPAELLRRL